MEGNSPYCELPSISKDPENIKKWINSWSDEEFAYKAPFPVISDTFIIDLIKKCGGKYGDMSTAEDDELRKTLNELSSELNDLNDAMGKRAPMKVQEPSRVPENSQWDMLLKEMKSFQDLVIDEHKEKRRSFKMIANSASRHVSNQKQRLRKKEEEEEKRLKGIAKTMAGAVDLFWKKMERLVWESKKRGLMQKLNDKRRIRFEKFIEAVVKWANGASVENSREKADASEEGSRESEEASINGKGSLASESPVSDGAVKKRRKLRQPSLKESKEESAPKLSPSPSSEDYEVNSEEAEEEDRQLDAEMESLSGDEDEIADLEEEATMPVEELLKRIYAREREAEGETAKAPNQGEETPEIEETEETEFRTQKENEEEEEAASPEPESSDFGEDLGDVKTARKRALKGENLDVFSASSSSSHKLPASPEATVDLKKMQVFEGESTIPSCRKGRATEQAINEEVSAVICLKSKKMKFFTSEEAAEQKTADDDDFKRFQGGGDGEERVRLVKDEVENVSRSSASWVTRKHFDSHKAIDEENLKKTVRRGNLHEEAATQANMVDGDEFDLEDFQEKMEEIEEEDAILDAEMESEDEDDVNDELDELRLESELPIEELLKRHYGSSNVENESIEVSADNEKSEILAAGVKETTASSSRSRKRMREQVASYGQTEDESSVKLIKREGLKNEDEAAAPRENTKKRSFSDEKQCQPLKKVEGGEITPVPHLISAVLREYQKEGLHWMAVLHERNLNGILADEMGLGKTLQTIAVLAHLACHHGVWGPHLVVVPISVMINWEMEFKKFCPGFKILAYYGSQSERAKKRQGWNKPYSFHVCIASYTTVVKDAHIFKRKSWYYLVLDEAQNIKNFQSKRWQTLLNFNSRRRILLTGTPLQNNLVELWSLMHFLMPHLFTSHTDFKEWFGDPLTLAIEKQQMEGQEGLVSKLHSVLRPFLLRRLKKDVEKQMPSKFEHIVRCSLTKRQKKLYDEFMNTRSVKDTLERADYHGMMNVLMQLRKVCNHPDLFEMRPILSHIFDENLQLQGEVPCLSLLWLFEAEKLSLENQWRRLSLPITGLLQAEMYGVKMYDEDLFLSQKMIRPAKRVDLGMLVDSDAAMLAELLSISTPTPESPLNFYLPLTLPDALSYMDERMCANLFNGVISKLQSEPTAHTHTLSSSGPPSFLPVPSNFSSYLRSINDEADGGSILLADGGHLAHHKDLPPSSMRSLRASALLPCRETHAYSREVSSYPVHAGSSQANQTHMQSTEASPFSLPSNSFSRTTHTPAYRHLPMEREVSWKKLQTLSDFVYDERFSDISYAKVELLNKWGVKPVKRPYLFGGQASLLELKAELATHPFFLEMKLQEKVVAENEARNLHTHKEVDPQKLEVFPIWGRHLREMLQRNFMSKTSSVVGFKVSRPPEDIVWRRDNAFKFLEDVCLSPVERMKRYSPLIMKFVCICEPKLLPTGVDMRIRGKEGSMVYENSTESMQGVVAEVRCAVSEFHAVLLRKSCIFPAKSQLQDDSGKLVNMGKLMKELRDEGHRCLLFTQFTKMLDILETFLNSNGFTYVRLDGSSKVETRQRLVTRFNENTKIFVFISSTRAGGIGLNLTGADSVIFYDTDWNPAMDRQAMDRCHRIGQTRDVHVYRLITEYTIEENIWRKQLQKRQLDDVVVDQGHFTASEWFSNAGTIRDIFQPKFHSREGELDIYKDNILHDSRAEEAEPIDSFRSKLKNRKEAMKFENALSKVEDSEDITAMQTAEKESAQEKAEFAREFIGVTEGVVGGEDKPSTLSKLQLMNMPDLAQYAVKFVEANLPDSLQKQMDELKEKILAEEAPGAEDEPSSSSSDDANSSSKEMSSDEEISQRKSIDNDEDSSNSEEEISVERRNRRMRRIKSAGRRDETEKTSNIPSSVDVSSAEEEEAETSSSQSEDSLSSRWESDNEGDDEDEEEEEEEEDEEEY